MPDKKKKIFPKIQTKLKSFLADESGKITKKDALGLAAGAMLLSGVEDVAGHTSSVTTGHTPNGHANGAGGSCTVNRPFSSHASGVVNGHYSGNVTGTTTGTCFGGTGTHGNVSHTNHSNHSSGGWC